jgi:hypothetical protein
MFLQVQVPYNQGLVKTFLAPREILMADFVEVVRAFGRFRSWRFGPDVDEATARRMASEQGATLVEARRGQG